MLIEGGGVWAVEVLNLLAGELLSAEAVFVGEDRTVNGSIASVA
jgi:hypothetical protein